MKKYIILLVTLLIICAIPMYFTDDKEEKSSKEDLKIWFPQGYEILKKTDMNDIEVIRELKQRLGFSLYYESVSGNIDDLFYATLADMDDIDMMYYRFDDALLTSGTKNEQFLNYQNVLDQMPNLKKQFDIHPELYKKACPNGVCTLFPATKENVYEDLIIAYRSDWAKQVGYSSIQNKEELQDVLEKERALFEANKLRNQGEYFVGLSSYKGYIDKFIQLFKTSNTVYLENEEVLFGPTSQEYRDFLTYMKTLFENKLLDPSIYENDETNIEKYFLNSQSSIMLTTNAHVEKLQEYAKENGDDLPLQVMSLSALLPEEYAIYQQTNRDYQVLSYGYVINQNISKEKLKKALQYLDYLYSDEGMKLCNYGIQGKHYETIHNEDRYKESIVKENAYYPIAVSSYVKQDLLRIDKQADFAMQPEWLKKQLTNHRYVYDYTFPDVNAYVTEKDRQQLLDIEVSLTTYIQETSMNFIFKSIDPRVDEQWEDFLSGMQQLGLQEYMNIKQDAYEAWKG